ncbi:MAG: sugar phosphate isomerase/epimerase family protein, partial [Candidatus Hydrogenedentales bacterium]
MTPTLFSVSYAGFWGQHRIDLDSFVTKAADLGYPAVEMMAKRPHLSVLDFGKAQLESLRKHADSRGVEIATIAGYTDFTSGKQSAEVPFVEMQLLYVKQLAAMAQSLGAKIIRVFTGYTTDETGYFADWDKCVKAIRESAAIAEEFGVTLGVQNHHDTGISTAAYVEFLDEVGHANCKAM